MAFFNWLVPDPVATGGGYSKKELKAMLKKKNRGAYQKKTKNVAGKAEKAGAKESEKLANTVAKAVAKEAALAERTEEVAEKLTGKRKETYLKQAAARASAASAATEAAEAEQAKHAAQEAEYEKKSSRFEKTRQQFFRSQIRDAIAMLREKQIQAADAGEFDKAKNIMDRIDRLDAIGSVPLNMKNGQGVLAPSKMAMIVTLNYENPDDVDKMMKLASVNYRGLVEMINAAYDRRVRPEMQGFAYSDVGTIMRILTSEIYAFRTEPNVHMGAWEFDPNWKFVFNEMLNVVTARTRTYMKAVMATDTEAARAADAAELEIKRRFQAMAGVPAQGLVVRDGSEDLDVFSAIRQDIREGPAIFLKEVSDLFVWWVVAMEQDASREEVEAYMAYGTRLPELLGEEDPVDFAFDLFASASGFSRLDAVRPYRDAAYLKHPERMPPYLAANFDAFLVHLAQMVRAWVMLTEDRLGQPVTVDMFEAAWGAFGLSAAEWADGVPGSVYVVETEMGNVVTARLFGSRQGMHSRR